MLKLRKNKRNDLYIFFARRDVRKLTCLTAKFQEEAIEPLQEIAWWSYGKSQIFQFSSGEEMMVNKLGVNALLPMLCRLRFSKSFQSDNLVYCDLNNNALDFFIQFYRNRFETLKLCWSLYYNYFMMIHTKLNIKLDKTHKCNPILIVKDIMEQT